MSAADRFAGFITTYSKFVIVLVVVASVAVGAGAGMVEQRSSLGAFQSGGTQVSAAEEYVTTNFSAGGENTTTVQIIARDDNVLDKQSLQAQLRLQRALRANRTVNATLSNDSPTVGIANAVATADIFAERGSAIRERGSAIRERKAALRARGANLTAHQNRLDARENTLDERGTALAERRDRLNATTARIAGAVNATRTIQSNLTRLNRSFAVGNLSYDNYTRQTTALARRYRTIRGRAATNLSVNQTANVTTLLGRTRGLERRLARLNRSRAAGALSKQEYRNRTARIGRGFQTIYTDADGLLAAERRAVKNKRAKLEATRSQYDRTVVRLRRALGDTRALQRQYDSLNRSYTQNNRSDTYLSRAQRLDKQLQSVRNDAVANLSANQTQRFDRKISQSRAIQSRYDALNASLFAGSVSQSAYNQHGKEIQRDYYNVTHTVFGHEYSALRNREDALATRRQGLETTGAKLNASINRTRGLQRRYDRLNRSLAANELPGETYTTNATTITTGFSAARTDAVANLSGNGTRRYDALLNRSRSLQHRRDTLDALAATRGINRTSYRQRTDTTRAQLRGLDDAIRSILVPDYATLHRRATALAENRSALAKNRSALAGNRSALAKNRSALNASQSAFQKRRAAFENRTPQPTFAQQRAHLDSMNETEIHDAIEAVLGPNATESGGSDAFSLMPTSYDPGNTTANATAIVATQTNATGGPGSATPKIEDAQLAIRAIATHELSGTEGRTMVVGTGIVSDELTRSMSDSLLIVGPLALVVVVLILIIAYRDLLDILLGLVGIGLVLLWTFGFMGWAGIAFNQIFVAIPVLVMGLSIDYAIHVVMRHREERSRTEGVSGSMRVALGSVGVALVLVTATAILGFLSNLVSSLAPIREFGIVSAAGIAGALVIFGSLIPALKVEIDGFLESRGWGRKKRAVGTGGGALGSLLAGGATAARKAPWVMIVLALALTVAGGVGASQVDTSFDQGQFLADSPPNWATDLPAPFAPGEYTAKDSRSYTNHHFQREDASAEVLIRGNVTGVDTLARVQLGVEYASDADPTVTRPNGETDVTGPLSVMHTVASQNASFNATLSAADTDGDGIPDRNVAGVYDALFATAPAQAGTVIHRGDSGGYEALRLSIPVQESASGDAVTADARGVATTVEGDGSDDVRAVATGQPVVFDVVQDRLLKTVIQSLLITLAVTFVFLLVLYRWLHGSATLGFLTLLPVGFNVAWILGTMYVLSIPLNVVTGLIASLTVGLGIAYSIHLTERYTHELDRRANRWEAMRASVTGTGGALLGSAATTVGGFGVLAFALLPALRQFGIITGLTIVYAFLGSVLVLPSLLALWTRYLGPRERLGDTTGEMPSSGRVGDEITGSSDTTGSTGSSDTTGSTGSSDATEPSND